MKCTFIWLILSRFLPSTFYSYYFFENRRYSLSTCKRVTFDFLHARAAFRSLKVMKVSFVNIVPSVWAVIYFFSLFFFLELQSCHFMTVFLGVNVCYLYRWLLTVWKKRCMQCQWCFAVVMIDLCKIMHSLSLSFFVLIYS